MMIKTLAALVLGVSLTSAAVAAGNQDLEKCYQQYGQVETTQQGGKKVTVYKDQAEVAADCNQKVIARAKKEKKVPAILDLAGVIGKNSNWQSAMPVYTIAAKADAKKATCTAKDPLYSLDLALASPADHAHAKGGVEFMGACWPAIKGELEKMAKASSGYTKDNVCAFLTGKKAAPAACKG